MGAIVNKDGDSWGVVEEEFATIIQTTVGQALFSAAFLELKFDKFKDDVDVELRRLRNNAFNYDN